MLWSAFCLGFRYWLVCTDIHAHALSIWLSILNKVRKNPFGAGVTLYLKNNLCPVSAMLAYPAVRPKSPGLLFMFDDGSTLSRDKLVALHSVHSCFGV